MTSQKLQIIALISGGKDSIFSILHCLANGHDVVALANLYPSAEQNAEDEDINSYMYQTVGHTIIPLYAEALGIPLYRQPIVGSAANSSRDYAPHQVSETTTTAPRGDVGSDETESLIPLLERIMQAHPGVNAVSTGAILSTYQRTRIESVAIRLGLVPLSFLWQYPYLPPYQQSSLLQDMRAAGQDARIIKVASGGLDVSFLWQNVADGKVVRKLKKRMGQFGGAEGGAVLGEGGEFETLAISGPSPLWKGRIEVGEVMTVTGEGGSALVRLKNARTVMDEPVIANIPSGTGALLGTGQCAGANNHSALRIPQLLDSEFAELLHKLEATIPVGEQSATQDVSRDLTCHLTLNSLATFSQRRKERLEGTLYIPNIMSPHGSAAEQMRTIIAKLEEHLVNLHSTASSIVSSTLLLHDMNDFTAVNPIYGAIFTEPIPPSRITVSCGDCMAPGVKVALSVVIDTGPKSRRSGLHVQSRSYWAPANIGPYSQAVSLPIASASLYEGDADTYPSTSPPKVVNVAGQIPLVPSSMQLVCLEDVAGLERGTHSPEERQFILQTVLSLQHLWRIGRAMDVTWWAAGIAFISRSSTDTGAKRVQFIAEAWKLAHSAMWDRNGLDDDEEEDGGQVLDAWDMKNRGGSMDDVEEKDTRSPLPDYSQLVHSRSTDEHVVPPCFVVEVDALPRGADIEWTGPGLANCKVRQRRSTEGALSSYITKVQARGTDYDIQYYGVRHVDMVGAVAMQEEDRFSETAPSTGGKWTRSECTVYTTRDIPKDAVEKLRPTVIPCRRIWNGSENGTESSEIDAFVVIRREAFPL
jgi:diphthine-ammonia ligase